MAHKSTKLLPLRIVITSICISILVAVLLAMPIIKHQFKLANDRRAEIDDSIKEAKRIGIQDYIELSKHRFEPLSADVLNALLPYESISLERTPCFGACPVYKLTFYRNGTAILEVQSLEFKQLKTFSGSISERDFARLTQLVNSAKKASYKTSYEGRWTDDYTAIITAESVDGKWTVSDYGQVSPIEVWALATVMHSFRESIEWNVGPIYPLRKPN